MGRHSAGDAAGGGGIGRADPYPRRAWLPPPVVLLCLLLYGATTSGRLGTWDADLYYTVTERFLTEGRLDVPRSMILSHEEWKGRDGRYYSPFDLGQSVANIPFYLVGRAAARIAAGGRGAGVRDLIVRGTVASGNVWFTALTVWVVWALAGVLGWGRRGRTGAALLYGLGTMAWPYAAIGFNQALATLGQTIGLWGAVRFLQSRSTRDALLAGAGAALGICVRLNTILAVPWFALAMGAALLPRPTGRNGNENGAGEPEGPDGQIGRVGQVGQVTEVNQVTPVNQVNQVGQNQRNPHIEPTSAPTSLALFLRTSLAFLVPIGLAVLSALLYNQYRFGQFFHTGYRGDANTDFSFRNIPVQFAALLVSPSKGTVFYVPIALLAGLGGMIGWRRRRPANRESGSPPSDAPGGGEMVNGYPPAAFSGSFAAMCGGIAMSYLLFFSAMAYGHSGLHSWGPRFFVPLMPIVGLLAWAGYESIRPRRWGEIAGKTLIAISVVIQLLAVTSDQGERIASLSQRLGGTDFYTRTFFSFEGNVILDRVRSVGEKAARLIYAPPTEAPARLGPRDRPSEKNLVLAFPAYPNFWWAYAAAMGILPRGLLVPLIVVGLLLVGVLFWRARKDLANVLSSTKPPSAPIE